MSPAQIVARARRGHGVIGWKLARAERDRLLERFRPVYASVVADHVTLRANVAADTPLPPPPAEARIVGRADDRRGVEALVVAVDGTTERPGGGTYHVTWSLGPGRRAKESNLLLAAGRWDPVDSAIPLDLHPARVR